MAVCRDAPAYVWNMALSNGRVLLTDLCVLFVVQTGTADTQMEHQTCTGSIKEWCIAWWHSGRDYDEHYGYNQDEHSDVG